MLCASQPQPLPGAARRCLRSLRRCRGFARGRGRGCGGRLACLSCQFLSRACPGTLSCPAAPRVCPPGRCLLAGGHAGSPRPLTVGLGGSAPGTPEEGGAMRQRSVPLGQLRGHAELPGDPPAPPSPTCCPAPRGGQGLATALGQSLWVLGWVFDLVVLSPSFSL